MHDPKTVAFEIRRPWPRRRRMSGRLYFPSLVTVWHNEPGGADSGTVCHWRDSHWKWHIHHWSLQVVPLQKLRRWALTRCEWCGGSSRKGDEVNHSLQWDGPRGRWWQGEPGVYHGDCATITVAHHQCTCGVGPWENTTGGQPYGLCATCGKRRGWRQARSLVNEQAQQLLATIPNGERSPEVYRRAIDLFKQSAVT